MIRRVALLLFLLSMAAAPWSRRLAAQNPPFPTSQGQAEQLLQADPELQARIADAIMNSGLTPAQLRQRLTASGYDASLLDRYLSPAASSTVAGRQTGLLLGAELDAVRRLGLMGETERDSVLGVFDSLAMISPQFNRPDTLSYYIDGLPVFGMDVFVRRSTRFLPDRAGVVPDDYRLGPGDQIALVLSGDVEQASSLEVSRDGFIVVPTVGTVFVANLMVSELRELLFQRLSRVYSGIRRGAGATTRIDISVSRLRSVQVYVVGEVQEPGAYVISSASNALLALYAAGGPTLQGSLRRVEVRRNGALIDSLDVYDYLVNGINSSHTMLMSGDVVFVPVQQGRIKMTGEVTRPAIYELLPGETLRDALRYAGGFAANALRQRIQIHRILPPTPADSTFGRGRVVVDIGPEQLARGAPAVEMLPGDSVTVFRLTERLRGFVSVNGNVWVPGTVGFQPGMQLSDAIRVAGGPKPDTYLDRILITRLRPDSTRLQLRAAFADTTGAVAGDFALQEEDEITVFSRTLFRSERYVVITGAVRQPGRLPYREGMTVRDAVLLASGLTADAFLKEAEIARVPDDRSGGAVATTIRVPLDSTYLFARGETGEYAGPPGPPALARGAPETLLQPYDNVLILRQPEWELIQTVRIAGQVRYPGPYALRTKTERLRDVLERAGGLTDAAYADGIEFYRRQDSAGRVGIDLRAVLRNARHRDNLILAAGDSVYIPEFDPVVMVRGAVSSPGAVAFEPGRDIDFYVRAAGGYAKDGDKKRAWVTQPNGDKEAVVRRFLLPDTRPAPRPGAEVTVPERDPADRGAALTSILGAAAQVLASVVTIIVVAR